MCCPRPRDAMRCYEAMCESTPWRGCRPLAARFCSSLAFVPLPAGSVRPPPPQAPCTHAWVAGVATIADEGDVLRCCKDAGKLVGACGWDSALRAKYGSERDRVLVGSSLPLRHSLLIEPLVLLTV